MNAALRFLLLGAIALPCSFTAAAAQSMDGHQITKAQEVKWGPGPGSIEPGAEAAVLYGDPGKEGLFALRLKMPKGYRIAPHSHPKPEVVTVISGTFQLGSGDSGDQSKMQSMPAGSFVAISPGMVHYASAAEETVIQLNSTGPWTLTYVKPTDDPRKKPK